MSVADETRRLADDMADPVWLLCPSADDPTLPAGTGCTSVTVQVSCPVVTVTNVGEAPATAVAGDQRRLSDTGIDLLVPLALGVGLLGIGGLFLAHGGRRGDRAGA